MVREKQLSPSSSVHAAVEYLAVFNNWKKPSRLEEQTPLDYRARFESVRWPLRIATSQRPHHTTTPASRFPLPSHVHVKTQTRDRERDTARISNPPRQTTAPFPVPPIKPPPGQTAELPLIRGPTDSRPPHMPYSWRKTRSAGGYGSLRWLRASRRGCWVPAVLPVR